MLTAKSIRTLSPFALAITLCLAPGLAHAQREPDERAQLGREETELLQLVNAYRADHGAPPLAPVPLLNAVAWDHSRDMASRNYFAHDDPDGRSPFDRMEDAGYDALAMGENLASGYDDARHTFQQWRTSPPHNAAMLDPEYRGVGIGRVYARGTASEVYWTMDLGDAAPRGAAEPNDAPVFESTNLPRGNRTDAAREPDRVRVRLQPRSRRRAARTTRHARHSVPSVECHDAERP